MPSLVVEVVAMNRKIQISISPAIVTVKAKHTVASILYKQLIHVRYLKNDKFTYLFQYAIR
ncbi:hypothetical protein T4D_14426 [Trichinella pseudospiralis]|uniref:Uncharacterized protein n=1 Tax=Trichinella pseudospiralis TaxID=6337 RepID=A0A0V1FGW4_TRIPS|nr:hypothetical protein T4D_14426 [Trichinella pseudospiralis]